jgi:hypothetical protein
LYPPLETVEVHVLNGSGALARVDQRIALVALLIADVALWRVLGAAIVNVLVRLYVLV